MGKKYEEYEYLGEIVDDLTEAAIALATYVRKTIDGEETIFAGDDEFFDYATAATEVVRAITKIYDYLPEHDILEKTTEAQEAELPNVLKDAGEIYLSTAAEHIPSDDLRPIYDLLTRFGAKFADDDEDLFDPEDGLLS